MVGLRSSDTKFTLSPKVLEYLFGLSGQELYFQILKTKLQIKNVFSRVEKK